MSDRRSVRPHLVGSHVKALANIYDTGNEESRAEGDDTPIAVAGDVGVVEYRDDDPTVRFIRTGRASVVSDSEVEAVLVSPLHVDWLPKPPADYDVTRWVRYCNDLQEFVRKYGPDCAPFTRPATEAVGMAYYPVVRVMCMPSDPGMPESAWGVFIDAGRYHPRFEPLPEGVKNLLALAESWADNAQRERAAIRAARAESEGS